MAEIIKKVTNHEIVEYIQDIAVYSFDLNYIYYFYDTSNNTNLERYLIRSWVNYLKSFLNKGKEDLLNVMKINREISFSINWGLRKYQNDNHISTILTDHRYDREFSDESKRPFVVEYDNDNTDVIFYFKEIHYNSFIITLNFLDNLLSKKVNDIKSFIYSNYVVEDVNKKHVEESIDVLSKLIHFSDEEIKMFNLVKGAIL